MPSISESINTDLSGYVPVDRQYNQPAVTLPTNDLQPGYNTVIRCPLPPIFQVAPDSLNQFYLNGKVPQTRLLSAITSGNTGGGSTGTTNVTAFISGGVVPPPASIKAQQAVMITTVLGPGQRFVNSFNDIGLSFQLLSVSSTVPARFELYGTANAQMADLSRALDQPPPAGTSQGIITDVALDTAPLQWFFQNRIGANGDIPQRTIAYATITNLSASATSITITLQYVPLEK